MRECSGNDARAAAVSRLRDTKVIATYNLTRTRKNRVLEEVLGAGLNPVEFKWEDDTSEVVEVGPGGQSFTVEKLVHEPTGFWFKFDTHDDGRPWSIYAPSYDGTRRSTFSGSWEFQLNEVIPWLGRVAAEHVAPDLWATLDEQRGALRGEVADTPFTADEQRQIEARLTEAKQLARGMPELTVGQLQHIESQLDTLIELSRTKTRIEWRTLFIGAFMSQVFAGIVPASAIQQILFVVVHGLAHMFTGFQPPPELSP